MQNTVILNPYIPNLYRYLEDDFVKMFFSKGILRLSSFEKFKKHKNETRLDKQEGIAILKASCTDSMMGIESKIGTSDNKFILCTSTMYSKEIKQIFEVNDCFEIFKPINFMISVFESLVKEGYIVSRIIFGPCCYKNSREIYSNITQSDIDNIKIDNENRTMDFNALFSLCNKVANDNILFLKTDNYSNQHEYRIIWEVKNNNIPEYIDLKVPNALQYCRKMEI